MLNDLALDSNGDLAMLENQLKFINGISYVAQKLKIRLQFFLAEWYLDETLGVPYFQKILLKNPNRLDVINYITKQILKTEGIKNIKGFNLITNKDNRRSITIIFTAITDYGQFSFNQTFTVI